MVFEHQNNPIVTLSELVLSQLTGCGGEEDESAAAYNPIAWERLQSELTVLRVGIDDPSECPLMRCLIYLEVEFNQDKCAEQLSVVFACVRYGDKWFLV